MHTDSKIYVLQSAHSLTLAANVVLSGKVVPENSRSSYPQRVFELGKIVSLMTTRPLENPSSLN